MDAADGFGEEATRSTEEGGGWDVEEDLDLPPELVSVLFLWSLKVCNPSAASALVAGRMLVLRPQQVTCTV